MDSSRSLKTSAFSLPFDAIITVRKENAKRPDSKSAQRYALYRNGQSVQDYIDASVRAGNPERLAKADLLWDKEHKFIELAVPGDGYDTEELQEAISSSKPSQFALEEDLRRYIAKNLSVVEPGLTVFVDETGISGEEYYHAQRRIDILAVDKDKQFVVIELKVSSGHEKTIGQLLRYMGWVSKNLANGKRVRGLIIAKDITDDLKLAASMITGVSLMEYEIDFKLKRISD